MFFFLFILPCYCSKKIVDVGEINESINQSIYFQVFVECTNKFVSFTNYLKNVFRLTKLARISP